jgi:hypothetical protein
MAITVTPTERRLSRWPTAIDCSAVLALSLSTPCWSQAAGTLSTGPAAGAANAVPAVAAGAVQPQTASFGVAVGVGETSNVTFAPSDPQSQTISTAELDFGLRRMGPALDLDATGDVEYLDYLQNAYGGQFLGRFDGLAALSLWSDRLKWIVQEDFGQTPLDGFTPVTPDNIENVNVLTTGPDLTLRPATDTFVRFGARYALSDYETSPFDDYRLTGIAGIGQQLSAGSSVSLNADVQEVRFNNTVVNTDFDRQRLYAGYDVQGARTELAVYAGVARVDELEQWTSTPIAQLELTRRLSAMATVKLTAGREYTDLADSFRDLRAGALGGIFVAPIAAVSPENYLSNYVSGSLTLQGVRTQVSLTGRWERDTYAQQEVLDDVSYGTVQLSVERNLSRTLTAQVLGSATTYHYLYEGFEDRNYMIGGALIAHPAEHIEVKVRYAHNQATGGFRYTDDVVFVTVAWRPLAAASAFPAGQPALPIGPTSPFGPGFAQ